jgi:hypothetical protein
VSGINLYAGGDFTVTASYIAKWDGASWTSLGTGMDSSVRALAVSGNDVYAGGLFRTAGGKACTNIARWNGTNWSALGSGLDRNGFVRSLAISGSNLYTSGAFTNAGGSLANYIAKWDGPIGRRWVRG